jgi:hypothetical protein
MTIISVVYVPEGIAMSADSRLTRTIQSQDGNVDRYILTDSAQKLVLIKNGRIGVSFTGDAITNGKTTADYLRVFDINEIQESDTIEEVVVKLKSFLITENLNVVLLVAGYQDDVPFVYSVTQHEVVLRNREGEGVKYSSTWAGDSEAADKLLLATQINYPLTPLKDAMDLSEFIVEICVKYQRFEDRIATCGGPIDVLVITKDYAKFVKHKILQP